MTKSSNIQAIEDSTQLSWPEWLAFLDSISAQDLPHKDIAAKVSAKIAELGTVENSGWWAQSVTVAYEQHIGRRKPGQRSDGSYEATATKTLAGSMDDAMKAWLDAYEERNDFDGVNIIQDPTATQTDKRRHWTCNLADGTRLNIDIYPKSDSKVSLAVTHAKLGSEASVERWKTYWKNLIATLG